MYEFSKIKLVIWDLDDTLWTGTLSEGGTTLPEENEKLVRRLTDIGIVNSICSKNDPAPVEAELSRYGIRENFVFLSVNWNAKGERIRQMIADMQLRPVNVLFLDDNVSNLEEARFSCEGIMTAGPEVIPDLLKEAEACEKLDLDHKRLKQYQVLEKKYEDRSNFASNEAFLLSSRIHVEFGEDCTSHLDRIADLVMRSNQLNFTKLRSSKEELAHLVSDPKVQAGYVMVSDRFGDYGLTGFYAIKDHTCIQFCFSCRTLGMGIEQYVYNTLGRPKLTVVGEVISDLSSTQFPVWINQPETEDCGVERETQGQQDGPTAAARLEKKQGKKQAKAKAHTVLIKGPCDLYQILPYIADRDSIDTEFTYTLANGVTIESTGHTTNLVEALHVTPKIKEKVSGEFPFLDSGVYSDQIYRNDYRVVVISILSDANLGVYRHKETGVRLALLEGYYPLTEEKNWEGYCSGAYYCANIRFTREMLAEFAEKYEFIGINDAAQIAENLRLIREGLPKDTTLAVMLGGELAYEKNTFPAYENRHILHKEINDVLRERAEELGIVLIDVNRYLVDQSSFYDHFNHYIKPVYYQLAGEIVALINEKTGETVKKTGRIKMAEMALRDWFYHVRLRIGKIKGSRDD